MNWQQLLSPMRLGMEDFHDRERDNRNQFQRDYDRLIFSAPFRRLQNKTQVFPLPGSIFVHNRLTHSLEVASVGRELIMDNNNRYWDLVRWHQLDKLDTSAFPDVILGANIANAPAYDKAVPKVGNYIDGSKKLSRKYDKKYYWYPIPSDQISLNDKLTQNPNW